MERKFTMKQLIMTGCFMMIFSPGLFSSCAASGEEEYIAAGYLPFWRDWDTVEHQFSSLTHLYLAFGQVDQDLRLEIVAGPYSDVWKSRLKTLRQDYPAAKIILAVGGWGADGFSDMALSRETRRLFIQDMVQFVQEFQLDGIDLDWEFPGHDAWGLIRARPQDKQNFSALMAETRWSLDQLAQETLATYELTFATGVQEWGLALYEWEKLLPLVDHVNLMCYDFIGEWSTVTGFHSNLYGALDGANGAESKGDPPSSSEISRGIDDLVSLGVPSHKLVLGIPAYGYGWQGVADGDYGRFQFASEGLSPVYPDLSYNVLKQLPGNGDFTEYWDDEAKVPWLYGNGIFITYDNPRSVSEKMEYSKKRGLKGFFIWELTQDQQGILLESALAP